MPGVLCCDLLHAKLRLNTCVAQMLMSRSIGDVMQGVLGLQHLKFNQQHASKMLYVSAAKHHSLTLNTAFGSYALLMKFWLQDVIA